MSNDDQFTVSRTHIEIIWGRGVVIIHHSAPGEPMITPRQLEGDIAKAFLAVLDRTLHMEESWPSAEPGH